MGKRPAVLIDVHAHVLPGVDDGPGSFEESCRMLKDAYEQGIQTVIATPHYSRRRGADGLAELTEQLQEKIRETAPGLSVYLGQETYYHEELEAHLKAGKALTMAGSRYVLVEFDPAVPYETLFRGTRKLLQAGYVPILAHMERYACLRQKENLEDLEGSGCIFQMNYESLVGNPLRRDVRWCRSQVRSGRIRLLGTDMHRPDFRPPEIQGAWNWLEGHVSRELLRAMSFDNPLCVIQDRKIK